jgi:hypothetical protein
MEYKNPAESNNNSGNFDGVMRGGVGVSVTNTN